MPERKPRPVVVPYGSVIASQCLHPGCTRKVAAGALCAAHARIPKGMTPVPTDAFRRPYGPAMPPPTGKAAKARRKRVRPSTTPPPTPMERLDTATQLLLVAARDFAAGVAGAWERVESSRSAVAGATLALYEAMAPKAAEEPPKG